MVFLPQQYSGEPSMNRLKPYVLSVCLCYSALSHAFDSRANLPEKILPAAGTIQFAFTPGDDAAGLIIGALNQARSEVLVQAYSFTHQKIADALLAAARRGVSVRIIADRSQIKRMERGLIPYLAASGLEVYVDAKHDAAHNKLMIIDASEELPIIITGSYNFTHAAQSRNAENVLVLRGNEGLSRAYRDNWNRHFTHSYPY